MLLKWRQHNPVFFFLKFLLFQACSESRLNLAMQAGQENWLRIKDKGRMWSGSLVARQHWSGRWQQGTQQGHREGYVQPKGWPWNDAGHIPAGTSPQAGMSHWALLLEPEYSCRCASQSVLFHCFQLGLRKCSISCTFKIALGWCLPALALLADAFVWVHRSG